MAILYLGKRLAGSGFAKQVVLKRLRPELMDNPDAVALFLREACLGASLEHPAIVKVHDLTEIDGIPYLVMEYVRGGDLRLVLRRARRRSQQFIPAAALYIGRELCAALDYTHSRCLPDGRSLGLIHRDISPNNILLSVEGEIKLTDFGIAQAEWEQKGEPRARGQVGYMSPEQARGEPLDIRSDLFSLGAVLYEVFTGRRLYVGQVGQSPTEVYGASVIPPSQACSGLPAEIDAVMLRALDLSAPGRPPSAQALYQELLDISLRQNLWMDRFAFARHLCEICGPDPESWATIEERTATALIVSIAAEDIADHDEPSGGLMAQATAMMAGDEPFEPVITVPWPTVSEAAPADIQSALVSALPSEDTLQLPPGPLPFDVPVVPKKALLDIAADDAADADADADDHADAVTRPAPRTSSEEHPDDFSATDFAADEHNLTTKHVKVAPQAALGGSLQERDAKAALALRNRLRREDLIDLLPGITLGLALSVLLWLLYSLAHHLF
jgi:serine/threonine protein kinase